MDKQVDKPAEQAAIPVGQTTDPKKQSFTKDKRGWFVAGGVVVAVVLSFILGWATRTTYGLHTLPREAAASRVTVDGPHGGMMMGVGRGGFDDTNNTSGQTVTHLSGVVTQVNGNTFTIAGNGTTKTITTNDSTVFNTSANKVTINDSVVVRGTDSNGTFTATNVNVRNQ